MGNDDHDDNIHYSSRSSEESTSTTTTSDHNHPPLVIVNTTTNVDNDNNTVSTITTPTTPTIIVSTQASNLSSITPTLSSKHPKKRNFALHNSATTPVSPTHVRTSSSSSSLSIMERVQKLQSRNANHSQSFDFGASSSSLMLPHNNNNMMTNNNNNNNNNNNSNISIHNNNRMTHASPHKEHFESVDFYSTLSFAPEEDEYDDDESYLMHSVSHYYMNDNKNTGGSGDHSNATTPTTIMMESNNNDLMTNRNQSHTSSIHLMDDENDSNQNNNNDDENNHVNDDDLNENKNDSGQESQSRMNNSSRLRGRVTPRDDRFLLHNNTNNRRRHYYNSRDNSWVQDHYLSRLLGYRNFSMLLSLWDHICTALSFIYYPLYRITKGVQVRALIFLICLGIVASLITLSIDTCIFGIENAHTRFGQVTNNFYVNYMIYTLFALFSAVFAAGCVDFISKDSAGSGLPEMKSILSGNYMARYLSLRTMVGKSLGVIAGLGAGLQIGRLGPFVHLSSCIGNQMLKLKYFRKLRKREFEKISMLQAACASGVASTFGSPIGGVLFSIEVTASTYPVTNLWRCIVVTLFGSLFFFVWRRIGIINTSQINLFSTDFPPYPYELHEILLFIIVGIVCGFIGAFFNFLLIQTIKLRKSVRLFNEHPYYVVCAATLLTALVSFPTPLMRFSPNYSINVLFSMKDLKTESPLTTLSLISVAKFILTPISLALPIPSGMFAPVFSIGAFSGRLFGELVKRYLYSNTIPAYYAVVAASALSVGVTRAMSTIVVVCELTGQLSLMLPVILASVFAVGVANFFNENIYDKLLKFRGLPLLSDIVQEGDAFKIPAKDIMRTDLNIISTTDTVEYAEHLVQTTNHATYPVVDNRNSMILIGSVKRKDLQFMLHNSRPITIRPSETNTTAETAKEDSGDYVGTINEKVNKLSGGASSFVVPIDAPPTIRLVSEDQDREVIVPIDPAPLSTSAFTPLPKVHFLFLMLRLSHVYVTVAGKLVGVIAKKDLIMLSETS